MSEALDHKDIAFLVKHLGHAATMVLSGAHSLGEVEGWLHGSKIGPSDDQATRLNFACDLLKEIEESQGPEKTRDWFLGAYAKGHDASPVEAIREGYFDAVRAEVDRITKDSPLGDL